MTPMGACVQGDMVWTQFGHGFTSARTWFGHGFRMHDEWSGMTYGAKTATT